MYRTNAQSRVLEEAFLHAGLPYKLVGAQRFYGRREIKDVIAYLRLVHNPRDEISLTRVINTPPRGIGNKTFVSPAHPCPKNADLTPGELLLEIGGQGESPHLAALPARAALTLANFAKLLADWHALAAELVAAAADGPHPERHRLPGLSR